MVKICAWCRKEDKVFRKLRKAVTGNVSISHGICPEHALQLQRQYQHASKGTGHTQTSTTVQQKGHYPIHHSSRS